MTVRDVEHPLVGRLVSIEWAHEGGCFLGFVRVVDAPREELRSLTVQLHGGFEGRSTLSAAYSGRTLRVPIEKVRGVVNRRRGAGRQLEPLEGFES